MPDEVGPAAAARYRLGSRIASADFDGDAADVAVHDVAGALAFVERDLLPLAAPCLFFTRYRWISIYLDIKKMQYH